MSDAAPLETETQTPTVAVFRPDDERLAAAADRLESLGVRPLPDPMLAVKPTDAVPRTDADYAVLTSKTGAELVADAGWDPGNATVCAIGSATADSLREEGYTVDRVPDEFTSSGLVAELAAETDGARVEVARSDHGSDVLLEGFENAGAYCHETVLYRLVRPEGSGASTAAAAAGELDGACFTSSLTVAHFLEAAAERGVREEALAGLDEAVVGVIGEPTAATAAEYELDVDLVASEATFETLASETVDAVAERNRD
ncbi:uroporphyrinogen-III synthase [Natrialba taiwanensis]|uniref:Uroporphyrinogen-III synthase n=1 Tax=Natrialba taiwanensis DSM 12281 TaxID=1230458 RepID=L9ZNZ2_9EURY|nr:uroporphyrinogen-III synthase [Natrialba taiwanensis]ELY88059.1 uroporphyrinogen-III synthase [Natrialba taiwanensis DSM 12281]